MGSQFTDEEARGLRASGAESVSARGVRESPVGAPALEVRVPASTANLGAGFDCFGLALQLYLTARARPCIQSNTTARLRIRGEGAVMLAREGAPHSQILRGLRYAAEREGIELPSVAIAVHNEIPPGAGLGGSAAAIVAGIALCFALAGREIRRERALEYAAELEGHADNAAAALNGGLNVACVHEDGCVDALCCEWPAELRVVVVTPDCALETRRARAILPSVIPRDDATHNLQRAALFCCALHARRYDLLWDAMQDRLHQSYRQGMVPGLREALSLPRLPGLVGLALSGAGPSVTALVSDGAEQIGDAIAHAFRSKGLSARVRFLAADITGAQIREQVRARSARQATA